MTVPDVILGLVEAAVPGVTVYDSGVPGDDESTPLPERYVVFWPNDGDRNMGDDTRVCATSTGERFEWQVSSVAPDRGMAAWLARTIRDAITDIIPSADGYACGRIRHVLSAMPDREEQVLAARSVLIADRYELLADRVSS